jgi:hypothetical protein
MITAEAHGLMLPKFVALDSSHLGAVARDMFSKDKVRQRRAAKFQRAFDSSGCVLALCWHHVQELLSYRDDVVRAQRMEFIKSLPIVAGINSFGGQAYVGTITDIQCFEVAIAFRQPAASVTTIRDEAAKAMFQLRSGADLIRTIVEAHSLLQPIFAKQESRNREIVAITRSDFSGISHLKVVDLLNQPSRNPAEIEMQLKRFEEKLSQDIRQRGDQRISNPESVSVFDPHGIARRRGTDGGAVKRPVQRLARMRDRPGGGAELHAPGEAGKEASGLEQGARSGNIHDIAASRVGEGQGTRRSTKAHELCRKAAKADKLGHDHQDTGMTVRFQKARGLTASEQLLAELCEKSFLSLWSDPNLYGKRGKELTDLLVVFGDDVILFSDKSCAFPNKGDAALHWSRWFRRSIGDSAKQIHQAEQWIKRQPGRVFLDVKATQPLPVPLPPAGRLRVHRVCIALGASERAKAATGYPTPELSRKTLDDEKPFAVGSISGTNGWVHVFDETP